MKNKKKVVVTGSRGLLGSAICGALNQINDIEVLPLSRDDCDLRKADEVESLFAEIKPDWVFHCAAKVGGIKANKNNPVEFLLENIDIQNSVLKAAHNVKVSRVIFFASNAVYPENINVSIKEEDLLSGPIEKIVRPYAIAKISGIELCYNFNKQYGENFLALIPVNLYGPNDNFHSENSHVLPALIRKFYEAVENNDKSVKIWGSGEQRREFMCSIDLARIACEIIRFDEDKFKSLCNSYPPIINIGVDSDISIKELAFLIANHTGYKGEVVFDINEPTGVQGKMTCNKKMKSFDLKPEISLEKGIDIISKYYLEQYDKKPTNQH
jgi:GDP-L-fucose synthase